MMKITVEIKTLYGKQHIYPVCERGQMVAELIGQKTLTEKQVECLKKMGYEILVQHNGPERL
jgi:hypothetical protein